MDQKSAGVMTKEQIDKIANSAWQLTKGFSAVSANDTVIDRKIREELMKEVSAAEVKELLPVVRESFGDSLTQLEERFTKVLQSDDFHVRLRRATAQMGDNQQRFMELAIEKATDYICDRYSPTQGMLLRSDPSEFATATLKLAGMGLYPDNKAGIGWIVPRNDNRKNKTVLVATPGVRGQEQILASTGELEGISGGVIRQQDTFVYKDGLNRVLEHTKPLQPKEDEPNQIIGSWCVVRLQGRDPIVSVKPLQESELEGISGYMKPEHRALYASQRDAMRQAIRTLPAQKLGFDHSVMNDIEVNENISAPQQKKPAENEREVSVTAKISGHGEGEAKVEEDAPAEVKAEDQPKQQDAAVKGPSNDEEPEKPAVTSGPNTEQPEDKAKPSESEAASEAASESEPPSPKEQKVEPEKPEPQKVEPEKPEPQKEQPEQPEKVTKPEPSANRTKIQSPRRRLL